jgi:hypothetical protein
MNAETAEFDGPILAQIHSDSRYANGLLYFHSHEHIPGYAITPELTDHIWFSYHNIEVSKIIPGIPDPYFDDCARGHALYLTGLNALLTPPQVASIFSNYAKVRFSISVIDLNSGETFRWIVMASIEDALTVLYTRNNMRFGSGAISLCHAFPPGKAILRSGRSIAQIWQEQEVELNNDDIVYARAKLEWNAKRPGECCKWFNALSSASTTPNTIGHTAQSSFVGYVLQEGRSSPQAQKNKLFKQAEWSPTFWKFLCDHAAAKLVAASKSETQKTPSRRSSTNASGSIQQTPPSKSSVPTQSIDKVGQTSESLASPQSNVSSPSSDVTVVPATTKPCSRSVVPATATRAASVAPVTPVTPVVPVVQVTPMDSVTRVAPISALSNTSWANIAAPSSKELGNLVFNLHPENKPGSTAPRLTAHNSPVVTFHQQCESLAEQMRTVLIFNLPSTLTLNDVSNAICEGPVLLIKFGTDPENGNRFVGIIFQYARHADAFHQHLLQERKNSAPGRFRFIVDVGLGPPYNYDDLLEEMEPPICASRRLTIVKKGFFYQFGKKSLRKFCSDLVGPDKIQLIWLYNGGNATVIFSEVRAALTVKTKLDQMAAIKAKGGPNMVSFEFLATTFSRDPCIADMNLVTDVPDLNED